MMLNRRTMIGGGTLLLADAAQAATGARVTLLGQALIQHDLRQVRWTDRIRFAALFAKSDACFTDLETTIEGPHGGAVTRDPALLHRAGPEVLDCLSDLHVNLFATANNHAYDVGTGGITDTMDALTARGLVYAGTGRTLQAAEAPALLPTPHGKIALVAMATGKIREGGAATPGRPGVNEIRQDRPGALNQEDISRFIAAISSASRQADLVLAYNHNHYWEPDIADVPGWQVNLAHKCIDAGAATFVGHGAPLLQGMEVHRGRPIFYGLGNFIYQSPSPNEPYGPSTWKSVVADCQFDKGATRIQLLPITLNPEGLRGRDDLETKGMPGFAKAEDAAAIVDDLTEKCRPFGTAVHRRDGIGSITITAS